MLPTYAGQQSLPTFGTRHNCQTLFPIAGAKDFAVKLPSPRHSISILLKRLQNHTLFRIGPILVLRIHKCLTRVPDIHENKSNEHRQRIKDVDEEFVVVDVDAQ
jgi:hypothetical protein